MRCSLFQSYQLAVPVLEIPSRASNSMKSSLEDCCSCSHKSDVNNADRSQLNPMALSSADTPHGFDDCSVQELEDLGLEDLKDCS